MVILVGAPVKDVKNICPFSFQDQQYNNNNRQTINQYVLNDKGPFDTVRPQYVPQLYIEMFATNSSSILFVMRSSMKGHKAFRLQRNNEYMKLMLIYVSKFNQQFVRGRQRVYQNFFYSDQLYQKFLNMTLKIAQEAELVHETQPSDQVNFQKFFLQQ
eukprot:TRINITY_DN14533_c0_g1_i1.p2 TRINITY_DN14533_c0_g1~~TRINITY_DN14533_c0_g1_i1.p2  ORF type:complete len:158 (-),score=1.60 TRINITY_DN14533_c0_g1_i1:139-612(-)